MSQTEEAKRLEYGVSAEQFRALDISRNQAVAAGAGSGKTRVLTRRYLRLLKEDPDARVDNILAITFTEKAALELRERVRAMLDEECRRSSDPAQRQQWNDRREQVAFAPISTIHGWCSGIIRENFARLDTDPAFGIIEAADQGAALRRCGEEAISAALADPANTVAVQTLLDYYGADYGLGGQIGSELTAVYQKIRESGMTPAAALALTALPAKMARLPADSPAAVVEAVEAAHRIEEFFGRMVTALDARYTAFKRAAGVLDFNDLELLALRVLEEPAAQVVYRERFKYFLIDEYQDTNPLQQRLIDCLVRADGEYLPRRLCVVGDHQQAIYGFRGADHAIFRQVGAALGEAGRVTLSTCYRSYPPIIDTVNGLFTHLFDSYSPLRVAPENADKAGQPVELISYSVAKEKTDDDPYKALVNLVKTGGTAEELRAGLAALDGTGAAGETADPEAEILVGRLQTLAAAGFAWRDMAVLLRSRPRLPAYEHSLRRHGIPFCVLGGLGFFQRQEIRDLIHAYRVIFNPADRAALVGVLRSPLFSLSDGDLVDVLSAADRLGGLSAGLAAVAAAVEPDEAQLLRRAGRNIAAWQGMAGFRRTAELLEMIIEDTRYREVLLTQAGGFQAYRNVEKLLALARAYDAKGLFTPREFPAYLSSRAENAGNEGSAALDTEDSDAVKIMTIHGAKGLEFRAVFIPEMDRSLTYHSTNNKTNVAFTPELGIVARGKKGEEGEAGLPNPFFEAYLEQEAARDREESTRLLYVAVTRAKEFLACIGKAVELKEGGELNSFMKMVRYALTQAGSLPSLRERDGAECRPDEPVGRGAYQAKRDAVLAYAPTKAEPQGRLAWQYQGIPGIQGSISQYRLYQDCARRYYLRCRAGLGDTELRAAAMLSPDPAAVEPEDPAMEREIQLEDGNPPEERAVPLSYLAPARRGTLVHRVLEKLAGNGDTAAVEPAVAAELQAAFPGLAEGERAAQQAEIARYVRNCLTLDRRVAGVFPGPPVRRWAELPFKLPLNPANSLIINGVVDRVDLYAGEDGPTAVIVDYKTNRIGQAGQADELTEYYTPQLLLYAAAVQRLARWEGKRPTVRGVYLYFLDSGEYREIPVDDNQIKALLTNLAATFGYIAAHGEYGDYDPNPGERCRDCEYGGLCEKIIT